MTSQRLPPAAISMWACVFDGVFLFRIMICFIYMFMARKPFDLSAIRVFNSRFRSQL